MLQYPAQLLYVALYGRVELLHVLSIMVGLSFPMLWCEAKAPSAKTQSLYYCGVAHLIIGYWCLVPLAQRDIVQTEHSLQMSIVKSPAGLCLVAFSFQAYDSFWLGGSPWRARWTLLGRLECPQEIEGVRRCEETRQGVREQSQNIEACTWGGIHSPWPT